MTAHHAHPPVLAAIFGSNDQSRLTFSSRSAHEDAKATYNRALAVLDEETRDGVSGSNAL